MKFEYEIFRFRVKWPGYYINRKELEDELNELAQKGYELVQIIPNMYGNKTILSDVGLLLVVKKAI